MRLSSFESESARGIEPDPQQSAAGASLSTSDYRDACLARCGEERRNGAAPLAAFKTALEDHLRSAELVDPTATLPSEGLDRAYLFYRMQELSPAQKTGLAQGLIELTHSAHRLGREVKSAIHKAAFSLESHEMARLVESVLDSEVSPARKSLLTTQILLGSTSLRQLSAVVRSVGWERLTEIADPELRSITAAAVLVPKLRKLPLPNAFRYSPPSRRITARLKQLSDAIDERVELIEEYPPLARSRFGRRLIQAGEEIKKYLKDERSRVRGSPKKRRELVSVVRKLTELSYRYELRFTFERDEKGRVCSPWKVAELGELEKALQHLPEISVLLTPKLDRVERQKGSDEGTYGWRHANGGVYFCDKSVEEGRLAVLNNKSALATTAVHEIGHGIKFGSFGDGKTRKSDINEISRESNPLHDLQDFVQLSDWQVIPPDEYRVRTDGKVEIEGEQHPLNRPVSLSNGAIRVFTYDSGKKTLYSFRAGARFAADENSLTGPWEDWCEAFTEYIELPKKLIGEAPEKFLFFELQFRKYRRKAAILGECEAQLAHRDGIRPRLQPMEQTQ